MWSCPGDTRRNNFDLLRLLAAGAVLVSHAYALNGLTEPHVGQDLTLGGGAVYVFFGISGFLICQSWLLEPRLPTFLAKRALRIYPALIVVLILMVAVLGPLVTTSRHEYLHSPQPLTYFGTNLAMWTTAYNLPGVFHTNPFPDSVNGSIWTLTSEIRAYLLIAVLGAIGVLSRRTAATIALIVFVVIAFRGPELARDLTGKNILLEAFCAGALLYLWRDKVPWHPAVAAGALAVWIASIGTSHNEQVAAIAFAYLAIFAAYRTPPSLGRLTAHGDFSYGIYLYAWPVTQLTVYLWPGVPIGALIAVSAAVTYGLAAVSWKFIEAPCLALKRRLVSDRSRGAHAPDGGPLTAAEH